MFSERFTIPPSISWRSSSSGARYSSQRRPPVISQTVKQPRVPPLRAVIADRDAKRLLLPYQHEQPLAPSDPRVDQVALQQHVVLRGERDHHCRKLRALRLVDRDRVSQRNLVQFPKVVPDQPLVEAHCDLLLDGINPPDEKKKDRRTAIRVRAETRAETPAVVPTGGQIGQLAETRSPPWQR